MVGKWRVAEFNAWIEHVSRVEHFLNLNEEGIEFLAEHLLDELGTDAAIAMLSADRSAETIQDRRMDLPIGGHHLFEIASIVHIQQRNDVRVPVSNMAEDRDRHALPLEEVFQVPD